MQHNTVIAPDATPAQRALMDSIVREGGVPATATVIYGGRRNTIYRYEPGDGSVVSVKAYRVPPFPNPYVYGTLRLSKARRAYENAVRLISLGLATPAPVGYIETRRAGRFDRSYYICRHLDEMSTVRDLARLPDRQGIIDGLARLMHSLRAKGVNFRDFSPGNVLYRPDGYGGYIYSLVDINRMTFDDYSQASTLRMFRAITLDEATLDCIAVSYARCAGVDPAVMRGQARAQLHAYLRGQQRKRAIKHLIHRV